MRTRLALAFTLGVVGCSDPDDVVRVDAPRGDVAITTSTWITTPELTPATTEPTTTTTATTTTTTTEAPPPTTAVERNLSRNGPFEPQGELWPRDGHEPTDPHVRAWLQGRDLDGWVVQAVIDWADGSPVETYEWPLEECGPAAGDTAEDPYPASNPSSPLAVEHTYEPAQRSFTALVTVTSVSCDGDEQQTATTELRGGETT